MKVEDAIMAHARWKTRLTGYLNNPDGSISTAELGVDNHCELGKWIHGEASRTVPVAELSALKVGHAKFHRAAADVVRKVDAGAVVDQNAMLGFQSEFGAASLAVVNQLKALAPKIG
jgi:hypothetical protein